MGEDCGGAAPIQLRGAEGVRRMTSETNYKLNPKVIKGVNACRKRKRSSETLPAEGIGYIPVTRGHREGFGDCAMCH